MPTKTVKIINKLGLHARAAAKLVTTASGYQSRVLISHNGNQADAKSIMALMMLVAPSGTELEITAAGDDAAAALAAVETLINDRFGEDE